MFGWFKNKKAGPEKIEPSFGENDAFKKGQKLAADMTNDLDEFMRLRFNPARDSLMAVVRERLESCFDRDDAPPLIAARIEYSIFLENVDELRPRMRGEIAEYMERWSEIIELMSLAEMLEQLIEKNISSWANGLTSDSLQLLLDLTDRLKVADDAWRITHPELSARMPPAS